MWGLGGVAWGHSAWLGVRGRPRWAGSAGAWGGGPRASSPVAGGWPCGSGCCRPGSPGGGLQPVVLPMLPGMPERRTHDDRRNGTTCRSPSSMLPPASSSARAIDAIGPRSSLPFRRRSSPRPRGAGHPHRHGQLRHSQDRRGQGLAGPATALACPLHTNLGLLDQSGRTLVRRTDAQAITTRRTYLHETTGSGHPGLHRKNNERPKPFKWTKSADDILASVKRFCHRTDQTLCGEL